MSLQDDQTAGAPHDPSSKRLVFYFKKLFWVVLKVSALHRKPWLTSVRKFPLYFLVSAGVCLLVWPVVMLCSKLVS